MTLYDEIKASYVPKNPSPTGFSDAELAILDEIQKILYRKAILASSNGELSCSHNFSTFKYHNRNIFHEMKHNEFLIEKKTAEFLFQLLSDYAKTEKLKKLFRESFGPQITISFRTATSGGNGCFVRVEMNWPEPPKSR